MTMKYIFPIITCLVAGTTAWALWSRHSQPLPKPIVAQPYGTLAVGGSSSDTGTTWPLSPGSPLVAVEPIGLRFESGEAYLYMSWGQSEHVIAQKEDQQYYSSTETNVVGRNKPFCHLDTAYSCVDRYFEFLHSSDPLCKPPKGQFYVVVCIDGRIDYAIRYFSAQLNGDRRQ